MSWNNLKATYRMKWAFRSPPLGWSHCLTHGCLGDIDLSAFIWCTPWPILMIYNQRWSCFSRYSENSSIINGFKLDFWLTITNHLLLYYSFQLKKEKHLSVVLNKSMWSSITISHIYTPNNYAHLLKHQ